MLFKGPRIGRIVKGSPYSSLENFTLYTLMLGGHRIDLYLSKKRATKSSHVYITEDGTVIWKQFYPFGGMSRPASESRRLIKLTGEKDRVTLAVIKGKPGLVAAGDTCAGFDIASAKGRVLLLSEREAVELLKGL